MIIDDEMREMIIASNSTVALRKKAQEKGMRLLSEDGLNKALKGLTTIEEISRVCEGLVEFKTAPTKVEPFVKSALPEIKISPKGRGQAHGL